MIAHYALNPRGRDFVVGDIHGHFSRLEHALSEIHFDTAADRLFSVGDVIDRGPESERIIEWLQRPWFHPVRGNHEDYAIRHTLAASVDVENYRRNGGGWLIDMDPALKLPIGLALAKLPHAIQVETEKGLVGIVHADSPVSDWQELPQALAHRRMRQRMLWSRTRLVTGYNRPVRNVHCIVVGHTPVDTITRLGNVVHIDTAGWSDGRYTLLDLARL